MTIILLEEVREQKEKKKCGGGWGREREREEELGFSTVMRFVRSGSTAGRNGLKVVRLKPVLNWANVSSRT